METLRAVKGAHEVIVGDNIMGIFSPLAWPENRIGREEPSRNIVGTFDK